jgi:hypothetical protein
MMEVLEWLRSQTPNFSLSLDGRGRG